MTDVYSGITTRSTPQSAPATPDQVPNAAGGYVFQVGDEARLHRFLTLGSSGSTYYTTAKELTKDNAEVVLRLAQTNPQMVLEAILAVSTAGRAPKQNPAIFALAVLASHGPDASRAAALAAVPQVCRTASTLFTFIKYAEQFRGWGPAMRRAVSRWYNERDIDRLAYQVVKYRQRDGWMHADVLRSSHTTGASDERNALYNWIAATSSTAGNRRKEHGKGKDLFGNDVTAALPALITDYEELQATNNLAHAEDVITRGHGISWEMLPDSLINEPRVWEVLLEQGVPQTALMRQLPRLTNLGLTKGATGAKIAAQLADADRLKKARVHPISVLVAQKTYANGKGEKGSLTWQPTRQITDALDAAFYAAYGAVEPAGKRTLIALDVSASMTWQNCSGLPITPRDASGAISLVTMATEHDTQVIGFCSSGKGHWNSNTGQRRWGGQSGVAELNVSPRQRLDDVVKYIGSLSAGGTDISLPMLWAEATRQQFDTFYVLTDNETWAGAMHPHQALEQYRQRSGIDAKMVVGAMTATSSSVCDPNDPRQLDLSGFDSSCPQLLADFSAGRV